MKHPSITKWHLALLIILIFTGFLFQPARAANIQTTFTSITSYHVVGAPDYNSPGNESFWSQIGWTNVPLVASVSPGGGNTSSVQVKSANDGYNIYLLFRWNDAQGPSYGNSTEEFRDSNGLHVLNPANTTGVFQLVHNATYYYPDRVAMLWYGGNLTQRDQAAPQMQLGSNGAISAGIANIWHWQSNPTDSNPGDFNYPGGYTDPKGNPVFPPNKSSFAEDDYTNTTGFFPIAGTAYGTPNLDPFANPFIILAGNYFSTANKTWTVEMVRPLLVPEDTQYRVQLAVGSTYFVGFAVWNGKMGESQHVKSVSQWYKFTLTNEGPPVVPATVGGVSLTLAAATGTGLLAVGLIVGLLIRPQKKRLP
jgi:hypothetical protein